jgi:hypothetical protein
MTHQLRRGEGVTVRKALPSPVAPNPKAVGERSEALILARLMEVGYVVLLPFGNNQRYDLVIDLGGGEFERAQCKTGRLRGGAIVFDTANHALNGKRKHYRGQADVFLVYCYETKGVYRVPVDECGLNACALRVKQRTAPGGPKARPAADYQI